MVFLCLKVFNSDNNPISIPAEETAIRNNLFSKLVILKPHSYLIRQTFPGYRCELGIAIFLYGGLLEITLTVPLRIVKNKGGIGQYCYRFKKN